MATVGLILLAYFIGSIPFALIASALFGLPDPRSYGSRNPGATNVLRSGNKAAALFTLFGDALKGYAAVVLAQHLAPRLGLGDATIAACALAAFAGHVFSIFLRLHGGKGVATALGVALALNPWLGLGVLTVWLAIFAMTRLSSLAALTAAPIAPILGVWLLGWNAYSTAVLGMAVLLVARHRSNIRKLLGGTEAKMGKPQGPTA